MPDRSALSFAPSVDVTSGRQGRREDSAAGDLLDLLSVIKKWKAHAMEHLRPI